VLAAQLYSALFIAGEAKVASLEAPSQDGRRSPSVPAPGRFGLAR